MFRILRNKFQGNRSCAESFSTFTFSIDDVNTPLYTIPPADEDERRINALALTHMASLATMWTARAVFLVVYIVHILLISRVRDITTI